MLIGYARVSTHEQSLDLQIDALKGAGCERIFEDHGVSGVADQRPGLERALKALSPGDTFVVWRLDRLARSMVDLTDTVHWLQSKDISFHSICEYIDTGSAVGELILHVLCSIVQFERRLIIERTNAGMEAARQRGSQFGRPAAINGETLREALFLRSKGMAVPDIAQELCVGRSKLYRYLHALDQMDVYATPD